MEKINKNKIKYVLIGILCLFGMGYPFSYFQPECINYCDFTKECYIEIINNNFMILNIEVMIIFNIWIIYLTVKKWKAKNKKEKKV